MSEKSPKWPPSTGDIPIDEFLIQEFKDDGLEEVIVDMLYKVDMDTLGEEGSPRRNNVVNQSHKMQRNIDHYEESKRRHAEDANEGDLSHIYHHIDWFLMEEFRIYVDEYGVELTRGYKQKLNADGSYTVFPSPQERMTNTVRSFLERNGFCNELIKEYEPLMVDPVGRVRFLLTLREAFEKDFKNNFVEEEK